MSDAKEDEIPRLPFDEADMPRLIEVVRDLYADVLRTFNNNASATPEEVLEWVAKRWIIGKQEPFMLLLAYWSATTTVAPEIWEEPTTSCNGGGHTRLVLNKSWKLRPLQQIDLRHYNFVDGDDFFACFEQRDAISQAQYDDLLDMFDERDKQLAS